MARRINQAGNIADDGDSPRNDDEISETFAFVEEAECIRFSIANVDIKMTVQKPKASDHNSASKPNEKEHQDFL